MTGYMEIITVGVSLVVIALLGAPLALWQVKEFSPALIRTSLWYGLIILVPLSNVLAFFIPLRSPGGVVVLVGVTVLAGAALGVSVARASRAGRVWWAGEWRALRLPDTLFVVALVVVLGWMLVASVKAPTNYDSGLYHIASIWYAAEFPAIPGIANVYPSFGFSNSLSPLTALTTNGPLGLEAYRVINSLFFLLLFMELGLRLASDKRNAVGTKILIGAAALFVAPMVWMVDYWVTSPTFDTPVAILTFISIAALADAVTGRHLSSTDATISLLSLAVASSMRQHYWFLFAFVAVMLLWVSYKRQGKRLVLFYWVGIAFSVAVFGVMVARDYVLSGWVLYPYKTIAFGVEWVAPDPSGLINATKLLARSPTPDYQIMGQGWGWIRPWLGANLTSWVFIGILVALVAALVLLVVARTVWRPGALVALLTPQLLFLATWFFIGAPHVRYMWAPLLLLGLVPLAWMWQAVQDGGRRTEVLQDLVMYTVAVELVAMVVLASAFVWPRLSADMPNVAVTTVPLNESIELLVPEGTDQCWENFPLCSGMPASGLVPLGNLITDGFVHTP